MLNVCFTNTLGSEISKSFDGEVKEDNTKKKDKNHILNLNSKFKRLFGCFEVLRLSEKNIQSCREEAIHSWVSCSRTQRSKYRTLDLSTWKTMDLPLGHFAPRILRPRLHGQCFFDDDSLSQKLWQRVCVHKQQRFLILQSSLIFDKETSPQN